MTTAVFTDIPFVQDTAPETSIFPSAPDAAALSCEVCGKPITYAGRGRRPKRCDDHKRGAGTASGARPKTTSGTQDVARACDVMRGLYDTATTGLLFVSPKAATAFAESASKLESANVSAFTSDPNLRDAVIRFGTRSGMAIFVSAHISAILPAALIVYSERAAKPRKPKPVPTVEMNAEDVAFAPRVQSDVKAYPNQHLFE